MSSDEINYGIGAVGTCAHVHGNSDQVGLTACGVGIATTLEVSLMQFDLDTYGSYARGEIAGRAVSGYVHRTTFRPTMWVGYNVGPGIALGPKAGLSIHHVYRKLMDAQGNEGTTHSLMAGVTLGASLRIDNDLEVYLLGDAAIGMDYRREPTALGGSKSGDIPATNLSLQLGTKWFF